MRRIGTFFAHALGRLMADPAPAFPLCPRCASPVVLPLGHAHSSLEWFRCVSCKHVWASATYVPPARHRADSHL